MHELFKHIPVGLTLYILAEFTRHATFETGPDFSVGLLLIMILINISS